MSRAALVRSEAMPAAIGLLSRHIGLSLLAACILVNDANFRVADAEEVNADWQTALRLGLCALCGLYGAWNLPVALRRLIRFPMAWLLVFLAWGWLTLPTAIAPHYAAAACAALTSMVLFTATLVERTSGESITKTIVTAIVLLAIGCWVAQFTRPELGQPDYLTPGHEPATWRLGGLTHPNGLGAHCALAIGLLFVGRSMWRWTWQSVGLLSVFLAVTLLATGSRTSCLMIAVGLAVLGVRRAPIVLALAVAVLAAAVFVGEIGGVDWTVWLTALTRDGDVQEISTFTGRTDLWSMAIDHVARSPLVGYGYGCSRYIFLDLATFPATHPHNLLLDTMVETGIPGALIELAMFLALLRRARYRPCAFPDVVLLSVAVMGIAEVPIFNPLPEAFTLSWMLALGWKRDFRFSILDFQLVERITIQNPKSQIQNSEGGAT
jgi:O-antigen ligase